MIEITTLIWFVVGLLAGLMHATVLWRGVHSPTLWSPLIGFLRLGIVAISLVVAAINGGILANAAGWAVGFVLLAFSVMLMAPRPAVESSPGSSSEAR